jgi:hypothetical protein
VRLSSTRGAMLLAGLVASALACPAPAPAQTPPPAQTPGPDLAPMALQPADFPYGGKVTSVQSGSDEQLPTYQVIFHVGDRASGRPTRGFALQFLADLGSADAARADLADTRRVFATRRGRAYLARQFATGTSGQVRAKDVRVRPPRVVRAGDGAFEVRYAVRGQRLTGVLALMTVDRIETVVTVAGRTGSRVVGRPVSLLRAAARRIAAGLVPGA